MNSPEYLSVELYREERAKGSPRSQIPYTLGHGVAPLGASPGYGATNPEGAAVELSRIYPGEPVSLYREVWTYTRGRGAVPLGAYPPCARRTELVGVYLNGEKVSQ